ncbi:hypothetical protein ACM17_24140 [Escherichia coli]|uniref:Uncharacterized protein n=1 Tax=Enterobacter roggenkampii TaxID=1812935 RepID=A0A837LDP5_9ENTR|nr:hypothetical protein CFSAN002050_01460 [Salmonella enterica subsp. enterica serovar Cubana str. CFSAN002050]APL01882.1 hypothetical protein RG56_00405 [Escherichia coli]KLQ03187.1 hypothetical protein ABF77_13105 [Enterobacter roggenkampii]KTH94673.1 hypothetical protein ASV15_00840 [Enterobacter hormaechei subsp. steigerwaltii]APL11668.1 hypothetical protein RG58_00405 [Escherichia coli]
MASYQQKKIQTVLEYKIPKKTPAKINFLMYENHHTSQICMNGV